MSLNSWAICFFVLWFVWTALLWFKMDFSLAAMTAVILAMLVTPVAMIASVVVQLGFGGLVTPLLVCAGALMVIRLCVHPSTKIYSSSTWQEERTEIKDGNITTTTYNKEL